MHEIVLSAAVFFIILAMAWMARRRVASVHLLALALFFPLMPLARQLLGASPRSGSDIEVILLYSAVLLYGVVFFACSFNSRSLRFDRFREWMLSLSDSKSVRIAIIVLMIAWVIRLFRWGAYGVAISGSGSAEAISAMPYWLSVASSVSEILSYGAFLTVAVSVVATRSKLPAFFLLLELVWTLLSDGRRDFALYVALLLIIMHQIAGLSHMRMAALSVFGVVFLWLATPLFISFREANADYAAGGYHPFEASLAAANSVISDCAAGLDCGRSPGQNIVERPNVLEFLREVISANREGYAPTYGGASVIAATWAIPSVLVGKPELMSEQFIQSSFGITLNDTSSSVLTLAYADFGILGVVAASAIVAMFFSILMRVSRVTPHKFFGACIAFSVISMMWNVEMDPTAYFVTARDVALIYFALWVFSAIRLKRRIVLVSEAAR